MKKKNEITHTTVHVGDFGTKFYIFNCIYGMHNCTCDGETGEKRNDDRKD